MKEYCTTCHMLDEHSNTKHAVCYAGMLFDPSPVQRADGKKVTVFQECYEMGIEFDPEYLRSNADMLLKVMV